MKDIQYEQPHFQTGPTNFAMVYFSNRPGSAGNIPSHWHAAVEVTLPLKNDILLHTGGKTYCFDSSDFVLVNSGEVHATEAKDHEAWVMALILLISDETFRSVKPDFDRWHFEIPAEHPAKREIVETLQHIYEAYVFSKEEFSQALINADIWQIVYLLLKNFCVPKEIKAFDGEDKKHYLARQAINHIEQNFRGNITLDETANTVGLQKNYFCRYFKKYTGMSFTQYLAKTRLRYALAYLTDFDSSVTESALQAGFPSVTAFTEVCKREYGVTPLQYKKQNE